MHIPRLLVLAGVLLSLSCVVHAQSSVIVVNANDNDNSELNTALSAAFDTVDNFNAIPETPTLGDLSSFNTVVAYTNSEPDDPVALGDVLADYVDQGGCVVIATYSFSFPWAITGRITDPGFAPLTNLSSNGAVSGDLDALVPNDPIFNGVDLGSLVYFHNGSFAHPGLDAGATLIADDGAGHNMIARNGDGNVVGMNLFPADEAPNNDQLYALFVNAAVNCQGIVRQNIPVPANNVYALALLMLLLGGLGYVTIRKYH